MAMASQQVFTLEAANALLPRVRELMGVQMDRRKHIEERLTKLAERIGEVPEAISIEENDPADVRSIKEDLLVRVEEYQDTWRNLEEMGGVLKDARAGLVDFYGRVDGTLVWLCWKYGEDEITHYHSLDEGFSGRKAIGTTLRQRHLN
jgi:hypothetical protein